jgi:hypothetical protein
MYTQFLAVFFLRTKGSPGVKAGMLETSLQGFVGQYLDALAVGEDPIAARGIGLIIDRFAISIRRAHEDSTGFSLSGRTFSRWFPGSRL